MFLARTGGAWSPAAHHHWPLAKPAARALLLCASVGTVADIGEPSALQCKTQAAVPEPAPSEAACLLGCLPPGVLLRIVKLAAEPMSFWTS